MKGYIARDADGALFLYSSKPIWERNAYFPSGDGNMFSIEDEDIIESFDDIEPKDGPIEVEIELKRV